MTHDECQLLFPNASCDFIKANVERTAGPQDTWKPAKLESDPGHGTLGKGKVKNPNRRRFLVRVTSVRPRLLDEDNLCEKYHVDLCRYAGIISGDKAGEAKIETSQRKTAKGEKPHTAIEVFEMIIP